MSTSRAVPLGLVFAALAACLVPGSAAACGDKFVRVGRGGRFGHGYVAIHPSSILVFVNPDTPRSAAMRRLPARLKSAGHRATSVTTTEAVAAAVKADRYDLLIAEAADLPGLAAALAAAPSPAPRLLPVAHGAAKYQLLVEIDAAMAGRGR